ncbi:MAG: two-component regulator propeller domain-containing protein, partial [Bacteroidota bacterium]
MKARLALSIVCACFLSLLQGQSPSLRFRALSQKDGLSQNIVRDILQDQQGFMWFATENGLNRYDGYQFRKFNTEAGIKSPNLNQIVQSADGSIWIGSKGGGLYRFDPLRENAKLFQLSEADPFPSTDDHIPKLFVDREDRLWVSTRDGELAYLRSERDSFIRVSLQANPGDYAPVVYDIVQDQEDQLWLGTNAGLFQLQAQPSGDFRIKSYQYETGSTSGLSGNIPWDLDLGPEGDLWIAGYGSGVDRFLPSQNQWQHYSFSEQSQQGLNSQLLTEITVDQSGIVWIGTQDR